MTDARQKGSRYLLLGGAALVGAAVVWWLWFFTSLTGDPGVTFAEAWPCLFADGGQCTTVRRLSQVGDFLGEFTGRRRFGPPPYQPLLLYLGFAALIAGAVLKRKPRPA